MNFQILELPKTNDTLDYLNMNIPFITAEKNEKLISKYAEKLKKTAESFRIFTDKDAITVNSNGILDRFYFDYDAYNVHIEGETVVVASEYRKETVDFDNIEASSIINMEETPYYMILEGFIPLSHTFDYMLDIADVPFSNMIKKSSIPDKVFRKIGNDKEIAEIVDLLVDDIEVDMEDTIVSYGKAIDFLIHKTKPTDFIQITGDDIRKIASTKLLVTNVVFEDSFIPEDDNELVSNSFMSSKVYGVEIDADNPIYILVDDFYQFSSSPINKKSMLSIEKMFISKIENIAHNVIISEDREHIEPEHIISNKEAKVIIDQFFYKIRDNYIDNIADFKEYMRSLCDIDIEYLSTDFSIDGGKIYIGFDYNNMNSIFNSDAIKNILLKKRGAYQHNIDEITYHAARYFKDQKKISNLSAYAEQLGINIDISTQKLAETFDAIRKVVAKLCIMSPDTVSGVDIPEFPIVLPSAIQVIPPSLNYIVPPLILPRIVQPVFFDTTFRSPLIAVPPVSQIFSKFSTIAIPSLNRQPYIHITKILNVEYPRVSGTGRRVIPAMPIISEPIYRDRKNPECKINIDGDAPTMVVFDSDGECRERYIATSNRTLNMTDAGAILSKMETEKKYGIDNDGFVIPVPEVLGFMLYETMMCMSIDADISLNVNFCDVVVTVDEDDERTITGFCSKGEDSTSDSEEIVLKPGKYFILNGLIIDEHGVKSGTPIVTETEWMHPEEVVLSSFVHLDSEENSINSKNAANEMSLQIANYLENVRYKNRETNPPTESYVGGFENIKNTEASGHVFMLDYVSLEAQDNIDSVYSQGGKADFMGIFGGLDAPKKDVEEIIKPKIAMTTEGVGVGGEEGTVFRIYDSSVSSDVFMQEVPYYVSMGDESLYVERDKFVLIEIDEGDAMSYLYDSSSSYSVTIETKEIPNAIGELVVETGLEITSENGTSKFIRIYPRLGSLSSFELPVPDCNAVPLRPIVPRQTPFIVIPVLTDLNGPIAVEECAETSPYYVGISRELEYDINIDIQHINETTNSDDFAESIPETRTITIPAGETKSEEFTITTASDSESEGPESFVEKIVKIYPADGGKSADEFVLTMPQIRTTIIDKPKCGVNANITTSVREGDNISIFLSAYGLIGCAGEEAELTYSISLVAGGTASVNDDFEDAVYEKDGEIVGSLSGVASGVLTTSMPSKRLYIPTLEDDTFEGPESAIIKISFSGDCDMPDGFGGNAKEYEVLIYDIDDPDYPEPPEPPCVITSTVPAPTREGDTATGRIILNKNAPSDMIFTLMSEDMGAVDGVDYSIVEESVIIPAGEYYVEYHVDILTDSTFEGPEAFAIHFEGPTDCFMVNNPIVVTIYDEDDPDYEPPEPPLPPEPPVPPENWDTPCQSSVIPPSPPVEGGVGTGSIIMTLPKEYPVTFRIEAEDAGATYGSSGDYFFGTSPNNDNFIEVTIPKGESSAEFEITFMEDEDIEGSESFILNVSNITDDCAVVNSPQAVTIIDKNIPEVELPIVDGGVEDGLIGVDFPVPFGAPIFDVKFAMSVGSDEIGCDSEPSLGSDIDPLVYENISDLSSVDPDTGSQDTGDVPGAVTMNFTFSAAKGEWNSEVNGVVIPGYTMKSINASICAVFGAVDGNADANGDVLAQGYAKDSIPEGAHKIYIGPSTEFASKVIYKRLSDSSWFTIPLDEIVKEMKDNTTGKSFADSGSVIELASSPAPMSKQLKGGVVTIGELGTPGAMYHYKHHGSDPEWPVVSTYAGAEATSLVAGSHLITSGGGPVPQVIHTNAENANEYEGALPEKGGLFVFINHSTITIAIKDMKAPLSQNRTVKFTWG